MERPFPAYQGDEPYIFVSYAHEDAEVVYPEIQWLKDQGFNIWYDEGIAPGHEWRQELAENIEACSLFLYFVSPDSVVSEHCVREVNYALDQKRSLLVVHLQETKLPSALAMSLSPIQAILRHELSDLDYRIKLLRGAGSHLERGIGAVADPVRVGFGAKFVAVAVVAALLVGGTLVGLVTRPTERSDAGENQQTRRFAIDLSPADLTLAVQPLGVTRDGYRIIFNGVTDSGNQLFSRALNELVAVPIRGTEPPAGQRGPGSFALSPDGEWVVFNSQYDLALKKVRLRGGTPITLAKVISSGSGGLSWGPDDTIVFSGGGYPGLMQISANGGTPEALTTPEQGMGHRLPYFLPDSGELLFTITENDQMSGQIVLLSIESGVQKVLTEGVSPQFTSSGHLMFYRDGALWAAAFDRARNEITSKPVPVVDGVGSNGYNAMYGVFPDGTLVYAAGGARLSTELVWVDRDGITRKLGGAAGLFSYARVSPDGDRIVVVARTQSEYDLWIYSTGRDILTRLTSDRVRKRNPVWSPDGRRIIYSAEQDGAFNLFSKAADGTGVATRLTESPRNQYPTSWSKNGHSVLLYQCFGGKCDLAELALNDGTQPVILLESDFDEFNPTLSPDGKWLAYASDVSGSYEIYVRPYPELDSGRWQLSAEGGTIPKWGPDGRELFYWRPSGMVAVKVQTDPIFVVGDSTTLFSPETYALYRGGGYDVAPDGDGFLMVTQSREESREMEIIIVENWFTELERLVPTNR